VKQGLKRNEKVVLRKASRLAIEETFSTLKIHFRRSRWIGLGNRYRTDTIERLTADVKKGRVVKHRHLSQYVAASAPIHCIDGWALLGRAIDCHTRRDYDSSKHFAYYAELRAAFSLLAAEGVGIFNNDHFVVTTNRNCLHLRGSTHKTVWQALEHWAELKKSTDLLGSAISINGISIQDWLDSFQSGSSLRPVGTRWLQNWGLDLRIFSDDRESRNVASYRPTTMGENLPLNPEDSSEFVCALWQMCEPSAHSGFGILDRHLLRTALEDTFRGMHGTTSGIHAQRYRNEIQRMIAAVIPDPTVHEQWANFLTRVTEPADPLILSRAKSGTSPGTPQHHLQIISRGALLLRTASAACSRLFQAGGIAAADLKFWWSTIGENRGLWERNAEPADFKDLWADAEAALTDFRAWNRSRSANAGTFKEWRDELSNAIDVLGECERIGLWGLNL
jgi:hypothetical protein